MASIVGATNKYYLSENQATPVRTVKMVAERGWLSKSWTLYTINDRPWLPRARFTNHPHKKKLAANLSLSEVFACMAAHEDIGKNAPVKKASLTEEDNGMIRNENTDDDYNPDIIPKKTVGYKMRMLMGTDPGNVFKQDIPSKKHNYWRNVQSRLSPEK